MSSLITFIKEELKNPFEVGAVSPSSSYCARETVRFSGIREGDSVLEAGAGTGAITFEIARVVGRRGKVYAVEVNPHLVDELKEGIKKRKAKNIVVVSDTVENISKYVKRVDAIISSLPLTTIPEPLRVMDKMKKTLKNGGVYVQQNYLGNLKNLLQQSGYKNIEMKLTWINIFPGFILRGVK